MRWDAILDPFWQVFFEIVGSKASYTPEEDILRSFSADSVLVIHYKFLDVLEKSAAPLVRRPWCSDNLHEISWSVEQVIV